jgi:phage/plasmid-like protein (TIGR03299 family)
MTVDVNTAFAATKTAQLDARRAARDAQIKAITDRQAWLETELAAGRITPLGGNRYRITQGWDAGETISVNLNQLGQVEEIVAEHGLDTASDGTVSLYSAVPAWHGLGQIIPGGMSSISEVLELARIGFGVEKRAVRYSFGEELRTDPDHYVTVRDDSGDALGTVGRRYQIIQNRDLFVFLENLVNEHGVIWESAGSLRGGRRVFVSMRVPQTVTIDQGGLDDEITLFLMAVNSHDGTSQAETVLTPWRPVCGNTERFALRDARARWGIRHTSGAMQRIQEARRTLGLTVQYADAFAAEETLLAHTGLAVDDFHRVIGDLWPVEEEATDRSRTIAANRAERLDALFRSETSRSGRTAYAAERAITDYLDHVAPKRPGKTMSEEIARATSLIEGGDDEVKNRAHKRLMALVRR